MTSTRHFLYDWGEPERAPHKREVWCEDVQYIYLSRTAVVRTRAMRDSHVGAHVSNIDTCTRTLIDCRLDYQG